MLPDRPAPDGSDIRKLTRDDVPRVARALARAFADDPVWDWVLHADRDRAARREKAFSFYLRGLWLREQECYTHDELCGAALWMPPGRWHAGIRDQIRLSPGIVAAHGRTLGRMLTVIRTIEKRHPPNPPHFYLAVLGIEPEFQGRGFGSALMRPVLDRCDREQVPAYLESSKERNVVLYERHGFRVVEELRLPKHGPQIWRMWRDPAQRPTAEGARSLTPGPER